MNNYDLLILFLTGKYKITNTIIFRISIVATLGLVIQIKLTSGFSRSLKQHAVESIVHDLDSMHPATVQDQEKRETHSSMCTPWHSMRMGDTICVPLSVFLFSSF